MRLVTVTPSSPITSQWRMNSAPRFSVRRRRVPSATLSPPLPGACGTSASGRRPTLTVPPAARSTVSGSVAPATLTRPALSTAPGSTLIAGLPMNCATLRFAGRV